MHRSKVVLVSGLQVFPTQSGGQLRTANIAKQLALSGTDVFLYSFTGRKKNYLEGAPSSESKPSAYISEYVNRNRLYGLLQFLCYRLGLPPVWLTVLSTGYLPRRLREELRTADRLVIDHPYLYPILKRARDQASRVLNTHNVEFHLWRGSAWSRIFLAPLVKRIETRALLVSQEIWCCSEDEKKVLGEMSGGQVPILVVPNAVPPIVRTPAVGKAVRAELDIPETAKVVLFTASQYAPNIEAFRYLCDFAFRHEKLLERLNVYLLVVGSVSSAPMSQGRMRATGPVPDVLPYFSSADLAINPVISGSGTSLKMYEYKAAGIPILSTPFGARGLGLVEGIDFTPFEREELDRVLGGVCSSAF